MNTLNNDLLPNNMRYYFAYGLNTNLDQMKIRCPAAIRVGRAVLKDHKFAFKTHADIIPADDSTMEGVLWKITSACEESLDMLEGYPFYYDKKQVTVWTDADSSIEAMVYYMVNDDKLSLPYKGYYDSLVDGYNDNKLDLAQLAEAIEEIGENYEYNGI